MRMRSKNDGMKKMMAQKNDKAMSTKKVRKFFHTFSWILFCCGCILLGLHLMETNQPYNPDMPDLGLLIIIDLFAIFVGGVGAIFLED